MRCRCSSPTVEGAAASVGSALTKIQTSLPFGRMQILVAVLFWFCRVGFVRVMTVTITMFFLALGQVPALANSFATTFQKKFACVRNLTMIHKE